MKQNRGILREYICVTRLFTLSLSGLQQKSIQYSGLSLVCMESKRSEHFFLITLESLILPGPNMAPLSS